MFFHPIFRLHGGRVQSLQLPVILEATHSEMRSEAERADVWHKIYIPRPMAIYKN